MKKNIERKVIIIGMYVTAILSCIASLLFLAIDKNQLIFVADRVSYNIYDFLRILEITKCIKTTMFYAAPILMTIAILLFATYLVKMYKEFKREEGIQ